MVIPTHNRSHLLALTLTAVLRQREVDLEVVVVDEASTDRTPDVIAELGSGRVRVIRHPVPRGVSEARNRGIAESCGEWVAFSDDDDLWAPDKLVSQIAAARHAGRDWAYAGVVNVDDHLRVISGRPPPAPEEVSANLARYNAVPGGGSNVVVHRDLLCRTGRFDARLRNTEDWEMWIRFAKHGPPAWVPRPLVAYRIHSANSSLDVGAILQGAALIEDLHGTSVDWGRFYRWIAQACQRTGRRRDAVRHYLRAAMRGQVRPVLLDLLVLGRLRLTRALAASTPKPRSAHDAWQAEAERWLHELRFFASQGVESR